MKVALALIVAASTLATVAPGSERNLPKPGVKEVQVSFASLKPSATIKIGETADWVLVQRTPSGSRARNPTLWCELVRRPTGLLRP